MIKSIHLVNYKCFEDHSVKLMPVSIIVGKNNAGKSTLIEALRLVAIITERIKGLKYRIIKEPIVPSLKALQPSIKGMDINFINIFHNYDNPPAIIEAIFENDVKLSIYIIEEFKIFAFYSDVNGRIIEQNELKYNIIPRVGILPQVAPLLPHEERLEVDYVKKNITTNLSFQHFRNQLFVFKQFYSAFKSIVEESWKNLEIKKLDIGTGEKENEFSLIVREGGFAAEISWMGHGIQMWLQTMWFIARTQGYNTVILDEPDVYMHADLQKKLIRMIVTLYPQVIIATHSIEIIQEVSYENIIILDRRNYESSSAKNNISVQNLIERLGTINNLQMARLWYCKKCIFYEGDDLSFLKVLYDKVYFGKKDSLDLFPNMSIGGWGGWNYAVGSAMFLKNATNERIRIFCLFDSDYHTKKEIDDRKKDGENKNIFVHIWEKKEIENYLINANVIKRIIDSENSSDIKISEVEKIILDTVLEEKGFLVEKILDSQFKEKRSYEPSIIMKEASQMVDDFENKGILIDRISGKQLIARINDKCKRKYNVSFSTQRIVYEFQNGEINKEILDIFEDINE